MEVRFKRNFICKMRGWLVPVSPSGSNSSWHYEKKKTKKNLTDSHLLPHPRAKTEVDRGRGRGGGTLLVGSGVVPNKVAVNQFLF